MKKRALKAVSFCLCISLAVTSLCFGINAVINNNVIENDKDTNLTENKENNNKEISKDETVYVLAGADGSVKKIIVSDWIKNSIGNQAINDRSELSDIVNVKGNETYTINGDNIKVWDAAGNDIYYQGDIEKELPVNINITYFLDGKEISPSELAGKNGHLVIRYDYFNNQYEYVEIDGKKEKIYVPFAMLTGMLLDNDVFTNVDVTNGKLINDGTRTVVVGIAFPGFQENLNIEKEKFEIPDYVEISADVKNFESSMTVTIAANEIFNEFDELKFDSADSISDAISELTNAMNKLIDGSSELYGGLSVLLDKSKELTAGINSLASGAEQLKNGSSDLKTGASDLYNGAAALNSGLKKIVSNNKELNNGAKQIFESLLDTANKQIKSAGLDVPALTIENYNDTLNAVISSLDENNVYKKALEEVTAAVESQRGYITSKVEETVKENVKNQVTASVRSEISNKVTEAVRNDIESKIIYELTGMDKESYYSSLKNGMIDEATDIALKNAIDLKMNSEKVKNLIESNINLQFQSPEIIALIESASDAQMASDDIRILISSNTENEIKKAISENMAGDKVQQTLSAASEGAKSLISLKSSLDSYNAFYIGLQSYTSGVSSAYDGASSLEKGAMSLKNGTEKLYEGSEQLYNGILELKNGVPVLTDGVTRLHDGSLRLSDGLKEFNEQGIEKITAVLNGDLKNIAVRLRAVSDVSENYKSFSGINDNMNGKVKFIYRTDSIKIAE